MITINLDTIIHNVDLLLDVYDLKKEKESILLYDLPEGSRLYPLDSPHEDHIVDFNDPGDFSCLLFSKVHEILYDYKYDIWFLCSDLNIRERYTKWCNKVGVKEKFKVLCFPFTVRGNITTVITTQEVDELNKIKNNKNFCQLISQPKVERIATVDRYYKHNNYEYSYVPHFHCAGDLNRIFPNMPYEDLELCNYVEIINGKEIYTIFPNGFDVRNDIKTLNEVVPKKRWKRFIDTSGPKFDSATIKNKTLYKIIFDTFLPLDSYKSCCDVVLESYLKGPIFYTEKTWKEFFFKRPFIMVGATNINHKLQDLGFKLYDEIFDYSFDLEENNLKRLKMFWIQIERYLNFDVREFEKELEKINDKLIHNRKTFMNWITNIDETLREYDSSHNLFNHLYLSGEFAHRKRLSDDQFNIIKQLCSVF